ncbi:transcription elongation factor GreA [Candidatus Kinetoplastibacterium blastocrithidii TCC012E]|uniref:Transcription elongation factor GreA n=1 Tax=Candidatus Kinetoplastidibacterium blastocrithidiae TCC012E TaxID=1208922 RepID=M1MCS5_9PROT|nr:transcription elongation factor GreA [Candidatus Kinetoplastibacterium blastocrithidii]AFZ83494.1 transcription elongation factor GreA [Candidatus Kinetoplastibacterium blastocrithidii (ex Strigomonas culicis)]AGF49590.1 transcription elongation factor GreA [Candidatus Kinetoplastibacterium blastocrithidii TCC012E]
MSSIPLTVKGAELLTKELYHLKTVERPNIIEAISEARSHGDLSENAEYDAAREKQGFIENRISKIENILFNAQIIDPLSVDNDGRIVFGATVKLEDLNSGAQLSYQIVGDMEADIKSGLISISSPMARAMIGKEEGDIIEVKAPSGNYGYEIINVSYI